MIIEIKKNIAELIYKALTQGRASSEINLSISVADIMDDIEIPKDQTNGDFSTNIALKKCKQFKCSPIELAKTVSESIKLSHKMLSDSLEVSIQKIEIANPGFINFFLSCDSLMRFLYNLNNLDNYGWASSNRKNSIIVEYVSANPTGPLHVGHARQAVLGDAISCLLKRSGAKVCREFYYNDAGNQIANLTQSVIARLKKISPESPEFPRDGYKGDYIAEIATDFATKTNLPEELDIKKPKEIEEKVREHAINLIRKEQNNDLKLLGVAFDNYAVESKFYETGLVQRVISTLKENKKTYIADGALWLKTTEYGDDKDRVMQKTDGTYTYFVPDVAYHFNKWQRGFYRAINIQGSDHHGTLTRVKAGLQGLQENIADNFPETLLHKMVRVVKDGKEVKFSKRSGSYVTLKDLVFMASGADDKVSQEKYCDIIKDPMVTKGRDAVRFFLLSKKPETEFTFDIDLAQKQSEENPVFYVQYAHARASSVIRQADVTKINLLKFFNNFYEGTIAKKNSYMFTKRERIIILRLLEYPAVISHALNNLEPHQIVFYVQSLASDFHKFYNESKILVDDEFIKNNRLLIVLSVAHMIKKNLELLGVSAPEIM